ncbi:hypothetical protein HanRHA438_Chr13g0616591 [Helianthus annuus]|nr:hypothetical protein HanHA89_Chr13g0529671 [Helianthus annuus]KAJ0665049.1 hypothetical protein HanLR1_Chr13g0499701 [Helianthus annuus]KAJ0859788.1 hypothetical protein HanRHA438_Chr13g0616591 [Helianthus annuus]
MMRKKALEDKKHKLDERAAALLALKKAKLHKEAPPAPSESDIDMGIFSGGRGNLLEEIFAASALLVMVLQLYICCMLLELFLIVDCFLVGVKSGKGPHRFDISQITPPASPPSRTIDLSPPRDDPGKEKKDDEVIVENVGEGGGNVAGGDGVGGSAGGAGGGGKGKGVDTEVESSETAPR